MQYLSFCDWLISLSTMSPGPCMLSQMAGFSSFLRLNNIPLCIQTIHLSVDGHLGYFLILAIVNNVSLQFKYNHLKL